MKILCVDRSCGYAIWTVLTPVSRSLVDQGHKVCWVRSGLTIPSEHEFSVPAGVETFDIDVMNYTFPFSWVFQLIQFVPKFSRLLDEIHPDVVHTNFAIPGIVARWVARKHGCKVVSTQHELYGSMNVLLRWGTRITERYADAVTYVSRTVAESFGRSAQLVPVPEWSQKSTKNAKKMKHADPSVFSVVKRTEHRVIYNSINFDEIRAAVSDAPERDPDKIVCVGRMVPEKGQRLLVQAFAQVLKQQPSFTLYLLGSGPDESLLHQMVKDLGIERSVAFQGWVSKAEVLKHMASASLVVQPSDGSQEGFGLSLVEAIACGAKVLVSDIPVFREVVGEGASKVYFFPVGQVAELAQAIVSVIDADGTDQGEVGFSDKLKLQYSNSANAAAYLTVYESLLSEHL